MLLDCLRYLAQERQVVSTTRSSDLLDCGAIMSDQLLAASALNGRTLIRELSRLLAPAEP